MHAPGSCHVRIAANGMQLPDPACTPGAVNPTLTVAVLTNPAFRTGMVRDQLTSPTKKMVVYSWYGITPPKGNVGQAQTCEMDHLVDLASGGADSLDNIWPQCQKPGAKPVPVGQREFKVKDAFAEHAVMRLVKACGANKDGGAACLLDLQKRIASDWTQFIPASYKPS